MAKYHLTDEGPKVCNATVKNCPVGDPASEHFADRRDAEEAFKNLLEFRNPDSLTGLQKTSITRDLLSGNAGRFPTQIIEQLGGYLEKQPYRALSVIPVGSALFNTVIPGKPVHDYDFMVLTTPHPKLRTINHHMDGELDVMSVDVTTLMRQDYVRSTSLMEAVFAAKAGRTILHNTSDPWSTYFESVRTPMGHYFESLHFSIESHSKHFVEPVSKDDGRAFTTFKHCVRWSIYQKRWGDGGGNESNFSFDPRLTDDEREVFLHALEQGRISAIHD